MLIYCDSVILIYYLDAVGPLHQRAANRLAALAAAGDGIAVSDLTRLECRVKPIQLGDAPALAKFDTFFALPDVRKVPLTTAVYDRATDIRAQHKFKTADAIHLAAAVESGCGAFLTNDARLAAFPVITVEILP
jgi:predicted nucleic acid-binding protein